MNNGHLLMDAGNSALKFCLEEDLAEQKIATVKHGSYVIEKQLDQIDAAKKLIRVSLSNVYQPELQQKIARWCKQKNIEFIEAKTQAFYEQLTNAYKYPAQLGIDRWLAMIAVWEKQKSAVNKRQAFFVASCGTAVTFDVVDADGQHLGGLIMPGVDLMINSLLENTAALKRADGLLSEDKHLADNTQDAIFRGTAYAVAALIETMMQKQGFIASQGYLTGGNASLLAGLLPENISLQPALVLDGLSSYVNKVIES